MNTTKLRPFMHSTTENAERDRQRGFGRDVGNVAKPPPHPPQNPSHIPANSVPTHRVHTPPPVDHPPNSHALTHHISPPPAGHAPVRSPTPPLKVRVFAFQKVVVLLRLKLNDKPMPPIKVDLPFSVIHKSAKGAILTTRIQEIIFHILQSFRIRSEVLWLACSSGWQDQKMFAMTTMDTGHRAVLPKAFNRETSLPLSGSRNEIFILLQGSDISPEMVPKVLSTSSSSITSEATKTSKPHSTRKETEDKRAEEILTLYRGWDDWKQGTLDLRKRCVSKSNGEIISQCRTWLMFRDYLLTKGWDKGSASKALGMKADFGYKLQNVIGEVDEKMDKMDEKTLKDYLGRVHGTFGTFCRVDTPWGVQNNKSI